MVTEAGRRNFRSYHGALILMCVWSLSGCSAGYLLQAAHGQWQVLRARQPISRLIAAPDTDTALKRRLELVREARDFATRELLLPDNRSYRSYLSLIHI